MSRRRWTARRAVLTLAALLAVIVGLAFMTPFYTEEVSFCPYCRATRVTYRAMFVVPLPSRVSEERLSRFWRREVEPDHKHTWWHSYSNEYFTLSARHGDMDYAVNPRRLNEDAAIAMLQSLPNPAARKAVISKLCRRDLTNRDPVARQLEDAIYEINDAYESNPNRRDWPKLLRDIGLAP